MAMQRIAEHLIAEQISPRRSTQISTPSGCSPETVAALFAKFRAIWGPKFLDQFHGERDLVLAKAEWQEGLAGLTLQQIGKAVVWCRNYSDWPPSIAAFRKAAIGDAQDWQHSTPAYRITDPRRLLKADRTDRQIEVMRQAIKQAREALK